MTVGVPVPLARRAVGRICRFKVGSCRPSRGSVKGKLFPSLRVRLLVTLLVSRCAYRRIFAHALPRLRAGSEAQNSQLWSPGGLSRCRHELASRFAPVTVCVWPVGLPPRPMLARHFRVPFARGPDAVAARVTRPRESSARATPPDYVRACTLASSRVWDGTGPSSWSCGAASVPAVPGSRRFGRGSNFLIAAWVRAASPVRA